MLPFFKSKTEADDQHLFFATDIHCHLIPGIDDGAPSVEKGMDLARALNRWGITKVIATPHVTEDTYENTPETIAGPLRELRSAIETEGLDLDVSHSAEFRIDDFSLQQIESGNIVPFPGNYLLVENSFVQEPWDMDRTLFNLKIKGFKLILAHPERYSYYQENHKRYTALHTNGMYFQINVLSLAGHYGKEAKRTAEWLAENGLVDFIGTDIHRQAHIDCIDRYIGSRDFRRHRDMLAGVVLNDRVFG